jgi:hypothetical protein
MVKIGARFGARYAPNGLQKRHSAPRKSLKNMALQGVRPAF